MPSKPGGSTAQVQSLTRGLSILEALARAEGGLTLTDVSQRVDLPPSTTHRLLATLDRMGYVYQAGELGRWYVGLQAFAVGSTFLASRDFVAQSHPHMRRLMEQSGETANLAILDGSHVVYVDQVTPAQAVVMASWIGRRSPAHASSSGKVLLAFPLVNRLSPAQPGPVASARPSRAPAVQATANETASVLVHLMCTMTHLPSP